MKPQQQPLSPEGLIISHLSKLSEQLAADNAALREQLAELTAEMELLKDLLNLRGNTIWREKL